MRILNVIRSLRPEYGGPAQLVRCILAACPRLGWEGEVACLDTPAESVAAQVPFPVHALGQNKTIYGYSTRWIPWLRQNIDRFDGVVIHGIWQYQSFGTWLALRGRKPYVQFAHGMLDPWFKRRYPLKHLKKMVYWTLAEHRVMRDASTVLFTCQTEQRLAPQSFALSRWNSAVVPYGAELPTGDPAAQAEAFYQKCPAARGRRFVLYLGRIHPKKGCDLLIEAFAATAAKFPDVDLVMAGPDAGMRAGLEARVAAAKLSSRVHWPSLITGDAKWGAFHASETFVLPSHQENFGIAVAEALGCSKPVLISDQVNIWPEIQEDGAGLVAPDTVEGTKHLLQQWLELSPAQREAMGRQARACFENRYNLDKNVAELLGYFARMQ
ncbi:MAG: glycosyltransferase [Acidobacteriaceae bacterium]